MPSSLLGLILLLAALGPGYVFILARGRRVPEASISDLRELVELALVGSLCTVIAALPVTALGALLRMWPDSTDLGSLETSPLVFMVESPWRFAGVLLGFVVTLLLACGIAYRLAVRLYRDHEPDIDARGSVWRTVFSAKGQDKLTVVVLDDGTEIEGYAYALPVGPDDEDRRELLLAAPIRIKRSNASSPGQLPVDRLVVPSDQIRFFAVKYRPRQDSAKR